MTAQTSTTDGAAPPTTPPAASGGLGGERAGAGGAVRVPTPTAEVDARELVELRLGDAVRALNDAAVRTEVDDDELALALQEIEAATARLAARARPDGFGIRYNGEGRTWAWGNAVVGARNAIAPPLRCRHEPDPGSGPDGTVVRADVVLGPVHEGGPGKVHGGVLAMLLDHLMGETASGLERPTVTGTLTLRYVRPTALGPLRLEGRRTGTEGLKTFVSAAVLDDDGPTVTAEGVFLLPRWARG